ncbi:YheU family protein [Bdellovibrio bacteriovorus]|uniref:YheU family protein n=1 Tax=Bdellovibrio bacteriovorus TaxID=959 RepID=UPI0021D2A7F6|nr:YheU family protein [Bdellovibrio bacteriovorus]UXR65892.1 YheU family protein [Bdellovibrio bacteriovorus]
MRENSQDPVPPIEISKDDLSPGALRGVIENFIQREGTDYGVNEVAHETKVQQLQKQIEKGHVRIVFDPNTESVTLMTEQEWKRFQKAGNPLS